MGSAFREIVTDCADPQRVATFWSQVLDWRRLLSPGATQVDIGQGDVPWVVLADPEGNEFCLLARRIDS
jgi:predicted enzyme related to lactoylglutathione lyase